MLTHTELLELDALLKRFDDHTILTRKERMALETVMGLVGNQAMSVAALNGMPAVPACWA